MIIFHNLNNTQRNKWCRMNIKFFKEIDKDKYHLVKSPYLNKKNKMLVQLAKQYDNLGYMKDNVGKELEKLFEDDSYIVGIHRTGYSVVDDEYLKDIFNKGLINNMDSLQSGSYLDADYLDIKKTVDLFYDPIMLNGQLKGAYEYKNSEGCIIVKIPKSYLGMIEGEVKPIYYKDGVTPKLLSEYIYGYIPVSKKGVVGNIINNPNYTDNHIYIDAEDTLLYETNALIRSQRRK